jgi:hypothetical protein
MSEQYPNIVPILASIITGVAAFLGVVLTNRYNFTRIKLENEIDAERKRRDLHRERGEELYVAVDKWLRVIGTNYLSILRVMHGKLTYNQHNELTLKWSEQKGYDFSRLEMIIDVYFPDIKDSYSKVLEARTEINRISAEHERQFNSGKTDSHGLIAQFVAAQEKFESTGTCLKEQIKHCISFSE